MKVVKRVSDNKIVYRQDPDFDDGQGIINAIRLFGGQAGDYIETVSTAAENLAETKNSAIKGINAEAQTRILAKYPLWVQTNCANGIYSTAVSDQMKADIAAVITAANTATDAVTAAIDEAGITAIMVAWPVI